MVDIMQSWEIVSHGGKITGIFPRGEMHSVHKRQPEPVRSELHKILNSFAKDTKKHKRDNQNQLKQESNNG